MDEFDHNRNNDSISIDYLTKLLKKKLLIIVNVTNLQNNVLMQFFFVSISGLLKNPMKTCPLARFGFRQMKFKPHNEVNKEYRNLDNRKNCLQN